VHEETLLSPAAHLTLCPLVSSAVEAFLGRLKSLRVPCQVHDELLVNVVQFDEPTQADQSLPALHGMRNGTARRWKGQEVDLNMRLERLLRSSLPDCFPQS
jgi:hypothetical protein